MIDFFLDGRVALHPGDCLDVLARLEENSIDSCVTDPPYHLTSIVKRFGAENAAPAKFGKDGAFARASKGFMSKTWDGGDVAFRPETWAAVYRVLKPGAHLVAFGGTRTFHRMACAIEDAGFEIRDTISWLYGSGFPKSHDVSRGIDRAAGAERIEIIGKFKSHLGGNPQSWGPGGMFRWGDEYFKWDDLPKNAQDHLRLQAQKHGEITAPATDAAREWAGWGTALKPACELIVLARKPLSEGTVAANVLRWGTGAINVDGCRVATSADDPNHRNPLSNSSGEKSMFGIGGTGCLTSGRWPANLCHDGSDEVVAGFPETTTGIGGGAGLGYGGRGTAEGDTERGFGDSGSAARFFFQAKQDDPDKIEAISGVAKGRWPANVITDGSDEVVAGFPESESAGFRAAGGKRASDSTYARVPETYERTEWAGPSDSGSAARYFYTAKADAMDRVGSRHPTIKPLDLMQWLVRLITPPKGLCLDPFAGTGTTGEAAWREGMRAVLIEAEPEYCNDIRRRMALALSGPDERARESIKEKMKGKPVDDGPLFGGIAEAAE